MNYKQASVRQNDISMVRFGQVTDWPVTVFMSTCLPFKRERMGLSAPM